MERHNGVFIHYKQGELLRLVVSNLRGPHRRRSDTLRRGIRGAKGRTVPTDLIRNILGGPIVLAGIRDDVGEYLKAGPSGVFTVNDRRARVDPEGPEQMFRMERVRDGTG